MSDVVLSIRPVSSAPAGQSLLPGGVLIGAIGFNALLAWINGHVSPLSSSTVILAEAGIVALAHAMILTHYQKCMTPWYALAGVFLGIALLRSVVMLEPQLKPFRDVLIVPTFVMLGMAFDK